MASEAPTSAGRTTPDEALRATSRLVAALCDPARTPLAAAAGVTVLETHVSFILLTGALAYKLKKPLALGFLDFTTLERRRRACEDELRLNRRTAPELYRRVVAITGTPDAPRLAGPGEAIEYAVEMRQFNPQALFSTLLARGAITGGQVDALAERVADFHETLAAAERAEVETGDSTAAATVRKNVEELLAWAPRTPLRARIEALAAWSERELAGVGPVLAERRARGFVRECHGDLHLANVALLGEQPVLFDCLEFDLDLRRIDVADEIAFAFMDFRAHGRPDLAARFVSAYLERTGDYAGVAGLRLFAVHRALVRAKVALIRAAQPAQGGAARAGSPPPAGPEADPAALRAIEVAEALVRPEPPRLVITCGLSGSGKTTVSGGLIEALEAIRIRSDVERKRRAGLSAAARSGSGVGEGLYGAEARQATYDQLEALAAGMLASGWSVIVDAAFLAARERASFRALARRAGVAFTTVVCEAPLEVLRERIDARQAKGRDASEADRAVLEHQLTIHEPLTAEERAEGLTVSTDASPDEVAAAVRALGRRLRAGRR